jgi:hypothetical protein
MECQDIIQAANGHFVSSTITSQTTEKDLYFCTSSTCHYTNLEKEGKKVLDKIDNYLQNLASLFKFNIMLGGMNLNCIMIFLILLVPKKWKNKAIELGHLWFF